MALRRPSPPRLQAGRPGAAPPLAPAQPVPSQPFSTQPDSAHPNRRAGRRLVLLAGAAAAVVVPVTAGTLLRREDSEALSAGPAQSVPGAGTDEEPVFEDVAAGAPGAEAIHWAHRTGVRQSSQLSATR